MNDQRIVNYSLQSDMIVSKKVTLKTSNPSHKRLQNEIFPAQYIIPKIGIEPYYTSAQILTEKYGTKYH